MVVVLISMERMAGSSITCSAAFLVYMLTCANTTSHELPFPISEDVYK